jgi:phenylalanyl-tRNA synthetase beta chain
MKISVNWLKTLIPTMLSAEEIASRITAAGLEVEGIEQVESVKGGLKGIVIGEVISCEKHPDADRLKITTVNIGEPNPLTIVCGAPNVAAGQKVLVATVGTTLYPKSGEPLQIKKSKIRGQISEGMICAEDEIGLGNSHDGILVLPEDTKTGISASDYFKLENDTVLEIGLTPNRSDAASHLGVARDLAAIINSTDESEKIELVLPGLNSLPEATGINKIEVVVENTLACKRYTGLVISGIQVKESPEWLKNRLNAIGLRPINNIVDIGNFVMYELGQPLHAFDYSAITGQKIIVRNAKPSEHLQTLDNQVRELKENDLLICNETEAMCLAGIFGGLKSGVNENTRAVFLESAYFDPASVRKSSKQHGLKTDASFRFERGTDPDMCITALIRAANLILDLAGGTISMDILDHYPEKLEAHKVAFSYSNCNELIGKEIDRHLIKQIILNLGIEISSEGSDGLLLHVPYCKHDVLREVDVIEEVMRIYGYDKVEPSKQIAYSAFTNERNPDLLLENKCASILEGYGFHEIMNLSLTKETYYGNDAPTVKLLNPLSQDLNVLRADMIYSGLECIAYNINRKNSDLKLYEFGRTYQTKPDEAGQYIENKYLSIFVSGELFIDNPYHLKQKSHFAYLKTCVEGLLNKCGIRSWKTEESSSTNFTYGLRFFTKTGTLVEFGLVSKDQLKKTDVQQEVFYASFQWEQLLKESSKNTIVFEELSKFPSVRRDLALLLDQSVQFRQIEDLAFATEKKLLNTVNLFDIYEDEKLGNKKSYAVSFTLLDKESTLTEQQIDNVMNRLISAYKTKLGAELR